MDYLMGMIDAGIDEVLISELGLEMSTVIAGSGSDNLIKPHGAAESGMGNLVADSLRYMLGGMDGGIGIVASGVVRNSFDPGQQVSFADIYSVLPLGMTLDPTQQDVPGYPLMQVNLTGAHLKNMCQLNAYVTASQDSDFLAMLSGSGDPTLMGLAFALSNLQTDYYLNVSGIQYSHFDAAGGYLVVPGSVKIYDGHDFSCQYPVADIDDETMYPCVFDIYMFLIVQSEDLQMLLGALGLPITPLNNMGEPVTVPKMLDSRLDRDPVTEGIQEVKEWMAFLAFLTADPADGGFADHIIPDSAYGTAALASGDSSRVTEIGLFDDVLSVPEP
jgi:hypothetical protein